MGRTNKVRFLLKIKKTTMKKNGAGEGRSGSGRMQLLFHNYKKKDQRRIQTLIQL